MRKREGSNKFLRKLRNQIDIKGREIHILLKDGNKFQLKTQNLRIQIQIWKILDWNNSMETVNSAIINTNQKPNNNMIYNFYNIWNNYSTQQIKISVKTLVNKVIYNKKQIANLEMISLYMNALKRITETMT